MPEVRITGGGLRGRRLYVPKAGIRPTTGLVREAVFSMLGGVEGARVLDLFAGSGALGIEALSRDAGEATFVDRDTGAVARNLQQLGLSARVERRTVSAWLSREARASAPMYDLVFCDPPYTLAADFAVDLGATLPKLLEPGGRVVIETAARKPLDLTMPLIKERTYGDTLIRIHGSSGG